MLVCVIIGLLIALSLPSLRGARGLGDRTVTLANLKSSAALFTLYAKDWKDSFPAFLDPKADRYILRDSCSGGVPRFSGYFAASVFWPDAMCAYFDGPGWPKSLYPGGVVGERPPRWEGGVFVMSCTVLADPLFWDQATRTGRAQFRAVYHHEVVHPSAKVLLTSLNAFRSRDGVQIETGLAFNDRAPIPFASVDGHAAERGKGEFIPGVATGEGDYDGSPTAHTFD